MIKGRRIYPDEQGWLSVSMMDGEYGRCQPTAMRDGSKIDDWYKKIASHWQVRAPNGHSCSLNPMIHLVTEHEDGTITVSPSIVIRENDVEVYHGFLERGFWRSVSEPPVR